MPPSTRFTDTHIALSHGNGGRRMRELIEGVFVPALGNDYLDTQADAACLPAPAGHDLVVTTDGFTVRPLEFPGGNIGSLALHGTINDLAVAGATPRYLTLTAILEEGLEVAVLIRVVQALGEAARACEVIVVAGDTKVVGRGDCDGLYLSTTGIGFRPAGSTLGCRQIRTGDRVLVSGTVGDHGAAVMLAREDFGLMGTLSSDCASVLGEARSLLALPGLRFMRDPTRGGLASVAHEIAAACAHTVFLNEAAIPLRPAVQSVCELLGFDPLYLACEGRLVAVVAPEIADEALTVLRLVARDAACIGEVVAGPPEVVLRTAFGGSRILDELDDDPLPRIC